MPVPTRDQAEVDPSDRLPPLPDLTRGAVAMPTLTREELAVLDDAPVLRDAAEESAWADLPEPARDPVRAAVLRGLLARDLVRPQDGALVLDDVLRIVLGVRHSPSFVAVADEVDSDLRKPLRGYGIDLAEHRTDAVLLEFAADGLHRFLLTSPGDAATRIAAWALEPREAVPAVARTLEVLSPPDRPDGSPPAYRRAIVLAGHRSARLAPMDDAGAPGEPRPVDAAGLADWLTTAWRPGTDA